jgi:glucose-6-phosphate dehydrogenase assembly protein OpcA
MSRDANGRSAVRQEAAVHRLLMRFGEADSAATPLWEERGTSVRAVAAHLARLWEPFVERDGADEPVIAEKGLPHARASVLNLIVTVVDDAAAERVVQAMLDLGVRHPSRAIVLVPRPGDPGDALDARISTHCHEPPGRSDRICYEEVILTVRGDAARHLAGVVAPLLIHDLPTHVWWPGQPPFDDPVCDQLVELTDRLIVDTADFADLLPGLRRLAGVRRRSGVGDLSWERLGWWQELTAQFFDAPRFRRYLPNLSRLHVGYALPAESDGAEAAPIVQALLYAGWIATRLGWKRDRTLAPFADGRLHLRLEGRYEMVELLLEPVETDAVPAGDLTSVRLRSLGEAGAAEFIIDRDASGTEATVATNADGMTALLRRVQMEPPTEAELLSGQLGRDGIDLVYTDALRAAAILLASGSGIAA